MDLTRLTFIDSTPIQLLVAPRTGYLAPGFCPRCLAKAGITVELIHTDRPLQVLGSDVSATTYPAVPMP